MITLSHDVSALIAIPFLNVALVFVLVMLAGIPLAVRGIQQLVQQLLVDIHSRFKTGHKSSACVVASLLPLVAVGVVCQFAGIWDWMMNAFLIGSDIDEQLRVLALTKRGMLTLLHLPKTSLTSTAGWILLGAGVQVMFELVRYVCDYALRREKLQRVNSLLQGLDAEQDPASATPRPTRSPIKYY